MPWNINYTDVFVFAGSQIFVFIILLVLLILAFSSLFPNLPAKLKCGNLKLLEWSNLTSSSYFSAYMKTRTTTVRWSFWQKAHQTKRINTVGNNSLKMSNADYVSDITFKACMFKTLKWNIHHISVNKYFLV